MMGMEIVRPEKAQAIITSNMMTPEKEEESPPEEGRWTTLWVVSKARNR
jgi:hypothetical protein